MYKIPQSWGMRREPRTPLNARGEKTFGLSFDEQFDWDILYSDAIYLGRNQTLLIGPPLYELQSKLNFRDDSGVLTHRVFEMDRMSITVVDTQSETIYLDELEIKVTPRSEAFMGVPSVMTMQKNEPIHWIKDWITYHSVEHGIRGFAIYNNNSTDYTTEELREALSSMDDVVVEVIDWSMPYGPETPYWDSDYSRYVMYENFKFRYGWCSKYALNQDIDELFIVEGGTADDVYEYLKENNYGSIIYGNRNIEPYNERLDCSASELEPSERVFKDYYYYSDRINSDAMTGNRWSICKWMTIPDQTIAHQWKNHYIGGGNVLTSDKAAWQIYFAHFYPLQSKNQDFKDSERNVSATEQSMLKVDELVKQKLKDIFN